MYPEVASAASHVTSLLHSKPASSEAFKSTLAGSLQARCAKSWHTEDPQRGSATRVLHWQPGPGGEGCSSPLLKACKQFNASFGPAEWTLWVDPGCVAIRDGPGPGRTAATFPFAASSAAIVGRQDAVRVLYGATPSPRPVARAPQFDFVPAASINRAPVICRPAKLQTQLAAPNASSPSGRVPSVTVSPSTPAVDADVTPAATPMLPWTRDLDGEGGLGLGSQLVWRARRFSDSSSSSTSSSSSRPGSAASVAYSNLSMDRGLSADTASSAGTSIPASSPPASASWEKLNFDEHEQQDETPACSAAPFAGGEEAIAPAEFRFGTAETELRGLGLEDLHLDEELGPDDAPDSFNDDDRHDEGDDTLRPLEQSDDAADETAKVFELAAAKAATELAADHKKSHSRSSSTVTSFDNGNVGVLGGGVKLGGSSSASSAGRSRTHSNASNVSAVSSAVGSNRGLHRGHKSRSSIHARTGGWAQQQQQQQQQQNAQQNMLGLSNMHQSHHYQTATHTYLLPQNYELQSQADALQHRLDQVARANSHHREASASEGFVHEFPPLPTEPLSKRRDLNPPLPPLGLAKQAQANPLKPKSLNALKTSSSNSLDTPKLSLEQDLPSPADSSASSYMSSQGDPDQGAGYDDEGDENDPDAVKGPNGTKRHRTRGRRSRGRGRTARRAAAAAAAAAAANGILSPPGLPSPHMLGQSWSTSCASPLMNGSGHGTPTMHHYQHPQFQGAPMTSPRLGQVGHHHGHFMQGHPQQFMPSVAAPGHYQPQPSSRFPLGPAQQQRSFQQQPRGPPNGGLGIGLAW